MRRNLIIAVDFWDYMNLYDEMELFLSSNTDRMFVEDVESSLEWFLNKINKDNYDFFITDSAFRKVIRNKNLTSFRSFFIRATRRWKHNTQLLADTILKEQRSL